EVPAPPAVDGWRLVAWTVASGEVACGWSATDPADEPGGDAGTSGDELVDYGEAGVVVTDPDDLDAIAEVAEGVRRAVAAELTLLETEAQGAPGSTGPGCAGIASVTVHRQVDGWARGAGTDACGTVSTLVWERPTAAPDRESDAAPDAAWTRIALGGGAPGCEALEQAGIPAEVLRSATYRDVSCVDASGGVRLYDDGRG
ncbi:MAG TPA: hypothetical protein VGE77_13120, partial [Nocardioides sp.]